MRAMSSAISVMFHAAVGGALLFGSTNARVADSNPGFEHRIYFEPRVSEARSNGLGLPGPIPIPTIDANALALPSSLNAENILPKIGASEFSPSFGAASRPGSGESDVSGGFLTERTPELLSAPVPVYPELLRQAGVQGKVVLEAVVDTTGRVLASSIRVVAATNPGFVASARQALLAALFRPATVGGRPIQIRVQIPYDFTIRNGIVRAR